MTPRTDGPDAALLRSAARRIAWQISAACAIVVIIVALIALSITEVRHGRPPLATVPARPMMALIGDEMPCSLLRKTARVTIKLPFSSRIPAPLESGVRMF